MIEEIIKLNKELCDTVKKELKKKIEFKNVRIESGYSENYGEQIEDFYANKKIASLVLKDKIKAVCCKITIDSIKWEITIYPIATNYFIYFCYMGSSDEESGVCKTIPELIDTFLNLKFG